MPVEVLRAALENPPVGAQWREVNLTGGDPLVIPAARRLFPEVLERSHLFQGLSVSTAGVPAARALAGLAALDAGRPVDVYVSVDGVGPLHDAVRGRSGAFHEVTAFLDAARIVPWVRLAITCVINRYNVEHLDEVADFAQSIGVPISYAVVNRSDHYINSDPLYDGVSLSKAQAMSAIAFLDRRSTQLLDEDLRKVLLGGKRERPCRLLDDGVMVTSDGAVSICGTSRRMVLSAPAPAQDPGSAWSHAMARRPVVLAQGAHETCLDCTTNCYAWRRADVRSG